MLSCNVYETFFGGARGGGKTDVLLVDAALTAQKYGNAFRGILLRRSFPELDEIIRRSLELYPSLGAEWAAAARTWRFKNGGFLRLRFINKDSDVMSYQGHNYCWIGFDELTNWPTDFSYIFMMGTARSAEGVPIKIRATGNPGTVGHMWVKKRFVDPAPPLTPFKDPTTGLSRVFINSKLADNEVLMRNDPEYARRLMNLPPKLQRAHLDGDWDVFIGQVFEEWDRDLHVVSARDFELERHWERFASMDWGFAKPFSIGWYAITDEGVVIRYREMYGCEPGKYNEGVRRQAKEVARQAKALSAPEGVNDMVADPSAWNKMGTGSSVAETFRSEGWRMVRGNNDRIAGKNRVHDLLGQRGHDGLPFLLVYDNCREFIRTFPALVADEKNVEDVDTKQEDHIYDELRYAIMSRFARFSQLRGVQEPWAIDERADQEYDPFAEQDTADIYDPLRLG